MAAATYTTAGKALNPPAVRMRSTLSTPFWRLRTIASARQVRRERPGRLVRVEGFHAEQHDIGVPGRLHGGGRGDGDALLEVQALQPQPLALERLDVLRPADEGDRHAGPRKHAAEVTADGARTQHRDSRPRIDFHNASRL